MENLAVSWTYDTNAVLDHMKKALDNWVEEHVIDTEICGVPYKIILIDSAKGNKNGAR